MIGDWILAKLSGVIATDPSNAGTTGILSLEKRDWDVSMAEKIGLKSDIFPEVLEPGTVIGTVTEEMASLTGLSTLTKVVMGGGDVQLGSAGLGVVKEGEVAILGGSFWQQVVNIKTATATIPPIIPPITAMFVVSLDTVVPIMMDSNVDKYKNCLVQNNMM
jgi:autoinducer 2 (AI-2) kinase